MISKWMQIIQEQHDEWNDIKYMVKWKEALKHMLQPQKALYVEIMWLQKLNA